MCENCWTAEIASFFDNEFWQEFDLALSKKLEEGSLRHNGLNQDQRFYECPVCREQWKLRAPDEASSGYLLRLKTPVENKTGPMPIIQIIIIGIVAVLFAKLMQYIFGN